MRCEEDIYGVGGDSTFLETPNDLDVLSDRLRALVPARGIRLFRGFPGSIAKLAEQTRFPPLAAWLATLRGTRCELEIHATTVIPPSVYLRFHHRTRKKGLDGTLLPWEPAIRLFTTPPRAPRGCPPSLREVVAKCGAINLHYMNSGNLVPADTTALAEITESSKPPPDFDAVQALLPWAGESPPQWTSRYGSPADYRHIDLARCYRFYEVDGDHLFYTPEHRTFWLGNEWAGDPGRLGPRVDVMLTRIFTSLRRRRYFHG